MVQGKRRPMLFACTRKESRHHKGTHVGWIIADGWVPIKKDPKVSDRSVQVRTRYGQRWFYPAYLIKAVPWEVAPARTRNLLNDGFKVHR